MYLSLALNNDALLFAFLFHLFVPLDTVQELLPTSRVPDVLNSQIDFLGQDFSPGKNIIITCGFNFGLHV